MLYVPAWQNPVRLTHDDLESVWMLHNRVHESLPSPDLFARETPAFFADMLADGGEIYGIKRHGVLLAYGVLGLPQPENAYNFGAWAGLAALHLGEVAHVDGAGVDPAHRGRGFQRLLIAHRLNAAAAAGRRFVYSTASPRNTVSLNNLLDSGFVIVSLRQLFGGQDRYILLHAPYAAPVSHLVHLVEATDLDAQRNLLADGLVGIKQSDTSMMGFVAKRAA
jgi:ribosomal protein S18 acetylase RimI-like enzyme